MYSAEELIPFVQKLRSEVDGVTVWIYSGFLYEEIKQDKEMAELLKQCDVLVDGEFVLEQRDITLAYKGSQNQRIIDVQKSLSMQKVITYEGSV